MGRLPVHLDRPGECRNVTALWDTLIPGVIARVSAAGASPLDHSFPNGRDHRNLRRERLSTRTPIRATQINTWILGFRGVRRGRIIDALHRVNDTEFQDRTDTRVVHSLKSFRYRYRAIWLSAVRLPQQIQEIEAVARSERGKVDHDIITLGHALLFELRHLDWTHD